MKKTLTVDDRSGTREITVEEALQRRTYRDALAGKRMAMREVVKWIMKREAEHVPKAAWASGANIRNPKQVLPTPPRLLT